MSTSEPPARKPQISGSWRVIRSRAVPANVTAINANESLLSQPPEPLQSSKSDVDTLTTRSRSAAYVETQSHPVSES